MSSMSSRMTLGGLFVLAFLSSALAQCNVTYINSLVSAFTQIPTVTYQLNNTTANLVQNYTNVPNATAPDYPTSRNLAFCNVTLALKHNNLNDHVRRAISTISKVRVLMYFGRS